MATDEHDRHAEVLARVRAALGHSARRDLGTDGIGADLGRVCRAAVDALAMSGAAVTLKSADGSEAVVAAVDDDQPRLSPSSSSASAKGPPATPSHPGQACLERRT